MHRSFKKIDIENFNITLKNKLKNLSSHFYFEFKVFLNELNRLTHLKKNILRQNNNAFMAKEHRKEITIRSKLKIKYNKERRQIKWCNFKRERNHCLNILRKTENEYFNNLNIKQVSTKKFFWKSNKLIFSDTGPSSSKLL